MKLTITTPPTGRVVDWTLAKAHLRLDDDAQQTYVEALIDAATDFAMESMACSLLTQTLTATYYVEDIGITPPAVRYGPSLGEVALSRVSVFNGQAPALRLPRGPVQSITSVTDGNGNAISYTLERCGHQDRLRLNGSVACPVTVVFVAGYGVAASVPALIRQGLLIHTATLYENRESVSAGSMSEVPHSLSAFYRLRGRKQLVS